MSKRCYTALERKQNKKIIWEKKKKTATEHCPFNIKCLYELQIPCKVPEIFELMISKISIESRLTIKFYQNTCF